MHSSRIRTAHSLTISLGGGKCGGGRAWQGGHAWQGRIFGRGHAWRGRGVRGKEGGVSVRGQNDRRV